MAAPSDTLAAAHDALAAGNLAQSVQLHRDYLAQAPNAPDAAKETLHLAYILLKEKAPVTDIAAALTTLRDKYPQAPELPEALYRLAMLSVRAKDAAGAKTQLQALVSNYAGTPWAAQAKFSLAHYAIKDKQFDQAITSLNDVANDPTTPAVVADEALLETGFLHLQSFFAAAPVAPPDDFTGTPTEGPQQDALVQAQKRLMQVASLLGQQSGDQSVHQTAAAYAECGVGETFLLQGNPGQAETWYRAALKRDASSVQAPVCTVATLGLGVSLYRQGRYAAAGAAFDSVISQPVTGTILYGLLIPDTVASQAQVWRARVTEHLSQSK